jgi:hypothetical protein
MVHRWHPKFRREARHFTQSPGHLNDSPIGPLCDAVLFGSPRAPRKYTDTVVLAPVNYGGTNKFTTRIAFNSLHSTTEGPYITDQIYETVLDLRLPSQIINPAKSSGFIRTYHKPPLAALRGHGHLTQVHMDFLERSNIDITPNRL